MNTRITHTKLDGIEMEIRQAFAEDVSNHGTRARLWRLGRRLAMNLVDVNAVIDGEYDHEIKVSFVEFEAGARTRAEALLQEVRASGVEQECPICMEPMAVTGSFLHGDQLACGHLMHSRCIRRLPTERITTPCGQHAGLGREALQEIWNTRSCGTCCNSMFIPMRRSVLCPVCRQEGQPGQFSHPVQT